MIKSKRKRSLSVRSCVEVVSVDYVKQNMSKIAPRSFTPEEAGELASKPLQTAAGFLALKKALVRIFRRLARGSKFSEKDFVLSHTSSGAPEVLSLPALLGRDMQEIRKNLFVSISHTKRNACALAACREPVDE